MEEKQIERKLKAELDFFKVYAIIIIGLVTGNVNLLLKYWNKEYGKLLLLLLLGLLTLLIVFYFFIKSIINIKKIIKIK